MTLTTVKTKLPQPEFAVSLDEFAGNLFDIYIPGDIPVCLWSPPGWGKSAKIEWCVLKSLKMRFIVVYGSSMQEVDASGLPTFVVLDENRTMTRYTIPELIIECEKGPTVVFWDELTRIPLGTINSLLPAWSPERRLGPHKFPPHTRHVAAANNCGSGNTTLPEAAEDRFNHQFLKLSHKEWLTWGNSVGLNAIVLSHIMHHPESLSETERDKSEKGHASPRQWESVARIVDRIWCSLDESGKPKKNKDQVRSLVTGSVGEGNARQFVAWMDILPELEPLPYVLSNPTTAKVPTNKSHLYIMVSAIAANATLANWKSCMTYLKRCGEEFQLLAVSAAVRKNPDLRRTEEYIRSSIDTEALVS